MAPGSPSRVWDEGTGSGASPRHTGKQEDQEARHGSSGFRAVPWRFGVGRGAHTQAGKASGRLPARKSGIKAMVERKAGQFCFSKGAASHLVTGKKPLGMLRGEGCRARGWRSRAGRARWLWLGAAPTASSFFSPLGHSCSQHVLGRLSQSSAPGSKEKPSTAAAFPCLLPLAPLSRPFIFGAAARRALQGENRAEDTKHGLRGDQLNAVI